ncbi:hypothetical protein BB561_003117 [Smittium simulii]|uniref:Glutamate--cysteine ligase n=1 Tax=Smittium simulii TaxID=133385 RepID=A0A2T9YMX1_9FUNG|nr:hypothetical protein BB561_003117 [Smittium simulii]
MGLLSLGTPLDWEEAKLYSEHVKENGIQQFLNIWRKIKHKDRDSLLWGDEIEYLLVRFDHANKRVRLATGASYILDKLQEPEMKYLEEKEAGNTTQTPLSSLWRPEFGDFMIEGTPGEPYGYSIKSLLQVEENMSKRRAEVGELLSDSEAVLSISNFPLMGRGDWLYPHHEPDGKYFQSLFLPDQVINPHPRFRTLASNIRQRRKEKVDINIPIYFDENTSKPFIDPAIPYERNLYPMDSEAKNGAAKPDHIYMDAMGFGMGCCCLQVTFQASSINEARRLNDQLAPISAILMCLSASTPILRGYLADTDCRWNIISAAVDDRTRQERGLEPLGQEARRIHKSRYATLDSYLGSADGFFRSEYNDIEIVKNEKVYQVLKENGVDELLAQHLGHLFIRDPLVIYKELLELDNENSSDHFENIQSTNWQNIRFKPPPPNSDIGWRVEFRPTEIQFTDFENAAFSVFIVLLTRAILSFDLDFYIPISKMDINMERAHKRDAVLNEKFYFRRNVFSRQSKILNQKYLISDTPECVGDNTTGLDSNNSSVKSCCDASFNDVNDKLEDIKKVHNINSKATDTDKPTPVIIDEMSIKEIMCGQDIPGGFPGLVNIVSGFLDSANIDVITHVKLSKYLDFIKRRATGEYRTNARYIRDFVKSNPLYKNDSVVNEDILYELLVKIKETSDLNVLQI